MTLKSEIRDEINKNKPKLCKGKIVNKLYCILRIYMQHTEEHASWLFIAVISIRQTSEKKLTYI
jgi:hypothetical protein